MGGGREITGEAEEVGGGGDGGEGFKGSLRGGATGLLRGPSAWELLIVATPWSFAVAENLKQEEEEVGAVEGEEEGDDGFRILI